MDSTLLTFAMWALVAWLGTGMWLVLTGRAGFYVEMGEEEGDCPLIILLALDLLAAVLSPWWMLRERLTGEPWE